MGLDMYLEKRTKEKGIYWRKSNWFHKWFIYNVQNGEDDCGEYKVSVDKLKDLRELCSRVIEDNSLAESLLPTYPGCFFGSYDYTEWYFSDIRETKGKLDKLIKEHKEGTEYWYQSSW
jgi:hypothetical protein